MMSVHFHISKNIFLDTFKFIIIGVLLFSFFFLGRWHIFGPISYRNFAAILLLVISFFTSHTKVTITKGEKWYFIWLGAYIFINSLTGYILKPAVYSNLIAYHLVSLILIFSLPRIVSNKKTLQIIIFFFIIFYVFNCILTIMQFYNNPIAWEIGRTICPPNEDLQENYDKYYTDLDNLLSKNTCIGVHGFVVTNGHFTACFLPIVTLFLWSKKLLLRVISIVVLLIALFSLYCIQQRIGAIIAVLYIAYLFVVSNNKIAKIFIVIVGFLLVYNAVVYERIQESEQLGRFTQTEDSRRLQTGDILDEFLSNPSFLLYGNCKVDNDYDQTMLLTMGHIVFLDALRRGGVITFVLFLFLFIIIIKEIYTNGKNGYTNQRYMTRAMCLSSLFGIVYSLFHSSGIPAGDSFFWLAYTLMFICNNIETSLQNKDFRDFNSMRSLISC